MTVAHEYPCKNYNIVYKSTKEQIDSFAKLTSNKEKQMPPSSITSSIGPTHVLSDYYQKETSMYT